MKSAILQPAMKDQPSLSPKTDRDYIKWFREIGIEDVPLVGGKTASLGEMFRELGAERRESARWICHHGSGLP